MTALAEFFPQKGGSEETTGLLDAVGCSTSRPAPGGYIEPAICG